MITSDPAISLERISSGVPGLDTVLRGGFLRGGVYIVQGAPGAGKTILANQLCAFHAALGRKAVYATLLSESHSRMLQHLKPMTFFDATAVPEQIIYISAFQALEGGLKALLELLRREVRGHHAEVLILDGFLAIEDVSPTASDLKRFVSDLQSVAALSNCTVFLLTNGSARSVCPEQTMVDGMIELEERVIGPRSERYLRVRKFRGSGFLPGLHAFHIDDDGIAVYPRVEAALAKSTCPDSFLAERLSSGVPSLDRTLHGGLPRATTTALIGPTGAGKTTLGLHFLALSSEEEPGLHFGFYETPPRLLAKAGAIGLDLAQLEQRGYLELVWQSQGENQLDALGYRLFEAVRRRGVKRLFVDGLGGIIQSAAHPERITRFFAVLANELRAQGVTTVYTLEMEGIFGGGLTMPVQGISSLLENLIMLRRVERRSRIYRTASIIKLRDSDCDLNVRELVIGDNGVSIGEPLEGEHDVTVTS